MWYGFTHKPGWAHSAAFSNLSPSVLSNGIALNKITITRSNLQTCKEKNKEKKILIKKSGIAPIKTFQLLLCKRWWCFLSFLKSALLFNFEIDLKLIKSYSYSAIRQICFAELRLILNIVKTMLCLKVLILLASLMWISCFGKRIKAFFFSMFSVKMDPSLYDSIYGFKFCRAFVTQLLTFYTRNIWNLRGEGLSAVPRNTDFSQ